MAEQDWFHGLTYTTARNAEGFIRFVYEIPDDNEKYFFANLWGLGLSKQCRGCGKEVNAADCKPLPAYWKHARDRGPMLYVCHRDCWTEAKATEAYECQCIDADCNDCKYFSRGKNIPNPRQFDQDGWCEKYSKVVGAHPNFCSMLPCFEHRLSKQRNKVANETF